MQICQLTIDEVRKIEYPGYIPDCHLHAHLSKGDAQKLANEGRFRFFGPRKLVPVGISSPQELSDYLYRKLVVCKDDGQYWGTAGQVRTKQLVNFMPRGPKHKFRIGASGSRGRK